MENNKLNKSIDITKVLAVSAPVCLLISIIYDWGFIAALNIKFAEFPSSIADHVRSSLVWAPVAITSVATFLIYELLTQRIEHGMTEDEIINSASNPEKMKKFRNMPYKFVPFICIGILVTYILLGESNLEGVPFAIIILWMFFAGWANNHPRIKNRRSRLFILSVIFVPSFFIWIYGNGYITSRKLYFSEKPTHKLYLKYNTEGPVNIVLFRAFDKTLMVKYVSDNSVNIIPWDEVNKVEKLDNISKYKGLLGKYSRF